MIKKIIPLLFIIILTLFPLSPFLHSGIFSGHDVEAHLGRMASFYQSFIEDNLIPRWGGNLNAGYGHPVLMFLFPLPMYLGTLFRLGGLTFVDSAKLVYLIGFILPALTMYLFINSVWGRKAAFVSAIFYTFAPYRFVDLYVRGAIGENLAFIFPPLICFFLVRIKDDFRPIYLVGGALSLAGMILSHHGLSLLFMFFIIPFALFHVIARERERLWQSRWNTSLRYAILFLLGLGISSFFWGPSLLEGKYTLRSILISKEAVFQSFASVGQLIFPSWGYGDPREPGGFSLQIGLIQLFVVLCTIFLVVRQIYIKKKNNNLLLSRLSLAILFFSVFMLLSLSKPVWSLFDILTNLQFPWRVLSLVVLTTAILPGYLISMFNNERRKTILTIILVFFAVFQTKDYWQPVGYKNISDNYLINDYIGTTDTGESTPRWSVIAMDSKWTFPVEIISGQATFSETFRDSTKHVYQINAQTQAQIRENTLYFPGWEVRVNDKIVPIEYQDANNRGVMTFWVEKGQNNVSVEFKDTKIRSMFNLISLISVFTLFFIWKIKLL